MSRDDDGHRLYKVKFQVLMDSVLDGPALALQTPGLPDVGSTWVIGNDVDVYAFCKTSCTCTPRITAESNLIFDLEFTFSTKPDKRCNATPIEDPLLEPQKVSGSFVKYTMPREVDRFGNPIVTSANQKIQGPPVEFDANRPQVKIEQNVADLQLDLLAQMQDAVNDDWLWGVPPRCIKLSAVSWNRQYHNQCQVYYTRSLEFDVRFETFDRDLADEGTQVLRGYWDTRTGSATQGQWITSPGVDGTKASDFIQYQDWNGNPGNVQLDGYGKPAQKNLIGDLIGMDATVGEPGTGYSVGNELTLDGGTKPPGGSSSVVTVTQVDTLDGGVYSVKLTTPGAYTAPPAMPTTTTASPSGGTGAKITVTFLQAPLVVADAKVPAGTGNTGGTGYVIGDVLTVVGGTGTAATLLVTDADSAGAVITVAVSEEGNYTLPPSTEPVAVTGGDGADATFNLTFKSLEPVIDFNTIHVEVYNEANFLLLGIPVVLT